MEATVPKPERRLVDREGKVAKKLRASATDRCSLASFFHMPKKDEASSIDQRGMLAFEAMSRMAGVLAGLGTEKIRGDRTKPRGMNATGG